jgi:DivIVA domain-containing protein
VRALAETYFKKVFKGYDTQQVDEFITNLSDTYEQNEKSLSDRIHVLETENERLLNQISELNVIAEKTSIEHKNELIEKQAEYDTKCAEIGEKMVIADKRAAEIVRNAEKEAALILTHARQNSENEAKVIRLRAEDEASRLIDDTRRRCESLSAAAEEFRARQDEMNRSMFETEKRFGDALSRLREGLGERTVTE